MAKATTIQSERGVIGEVTRDEEEKEGTYRRSPRLHSHRSDNGEPSDTETVEGCASFIIDD